MLAKTLYNGVEIWPIVGPQASGLTVSADFGGLLFEEYEEGDPNLIVVSNPTDTPILLLDGLVVSGLLQDRMISQNVMIQPRATEAVEVNCVERGRFHSPKRAAVVGRAPLVVSRAGREHRNDQTVDNPSARNRQHEVWRVVSELNNRDRRSPTESLVEILQMESRDRIDHSAAGESWRGYVIAVGGEPLLIEVASEEINLRAHGVLAADAITAGDSRSSRESERLAIQRFIEAFLEQIEKEAFPDGDGTTRNVQTENLSVSFTSFERHYFASAINIRHPELAVV